MSTLQQPINIPTSSMKSENIIFSDGQQQFSSPISTSSPFSNLSAGSVATNGLLASSFATSPPTSDDMRSNNVAKQEINDSAPEIPVQKKHKPHKCDVCGACFARKVHLQRHSLRHQVCKPYCCERCGKCFSRQDSLVRHHRLLHESGREKGKSSSASSGATLTSAKKGKKSVKTNATTTTSSSSLPNLEPAQACIRCKSIAVHCDGKQPCTRCELNGNDSSCCYAPGSNSTTIGAAFKRNARIRHDSVATTTSSFTTEDDETLSTLSDSAQSWTTVGIPHHRRDTMSSIGSSMTEFMSPITASSSGTNGVWSSFSPSSQQQQPRSHPFELPQLDSNYSEVKPQILSHLLPGNLQEANNQMTPQLLSLVDHMPSVDAAFRLGLSQHQFDESNPIQQQQHEMHSYSSNVPSFDWSWLMQQNGNLNNGAMMKQPFNGAASNLALNATLLSGVEESMNVDSNFPSPAILTSLINSNKPSLPSQHLYGANAIFPTSLTPQNLSRQASVAGEHQTRNEMSGSLLLSAMPKMADSF